MRNLVRVFGVLGAAALVTAAPASADQDAYLRPLQQKFVFLSAERLLNEGNRICAVVQSGQPSANAVDMVQHDLGVSVSGASEIISAAVVYLGC